MSSSESVYDPRTQRKRPPCGGPLALLNNDRGGSGSNGDNQARVTPDLSSPSADEPLSLPLSCVRSGGERVLILYGKVDLLA
jgi:hypothetical protein